MKLQKMEATEQKNVLGGLPGSKYGRRHMLLRAGAVLGASALLPALATPAHATSGNDDADDIAGLWQGTVTASDNSFSFQAISLFGAGLFISSGNTDLTPASLSSTLWGTYKRIGNRTFKAGGRFWTYNPDGSPSGFGAFESTIVVSEDGQTQRQDGGPLQFFDVNGISLGPPIILLGTLARINAIP
jgi:hypothetical protein